jgi:hypothetical protein
MITSAPTQNDRDHQDYNGVNIVLSVFLLHFFSTIRAYDDKRSIEQERFCFYLLRKPWPNILTISSRYMRLPDFQQIARRRCTPANGRALPLCLPLQRLVEKAHDSFCKLSVDLLFFRKQPRFCFAVLGRTIWKDAVAIAPAKPRKASARSELMNWSNTPITAPNSTIAAATTASAFQMFIG